MGKRKILTIMLISAFVILSFSNSYFINSYNVIVKADPGDISESWHNDTTLNVTVLQLQPRINWYDLQNTTGASMLNGQIDVNLQYYFIVNISSDQGWADIQYVNITAWHDLGNEASSYNSTLGGNLNMFLQYENTTGTPNWNLIWPSSEVTFIVGSCTDIIVNDATGSPGNTECHNLTFVWIPGYQFRYAPDPTDSVVGYNDTWSWNFNITCDDSSGYHSYSNPIIGETINEFGVYSYTEIVGAGWPSITGNPGDSPAYNDSYINIETRSNNNYSLSVNITNLTHKTSPTYYIQNTSIFTAGGDLNPLTLFIGNAPQYYYGGTSSYKAAENDSNSLTTSDVEWAVNIPLGQFPGDYNATIYYNLRTET